VNENLADFAQLLDRLEHIDPGAADDPVLAFYRSIAALRQASGPAPELAQPCLDLWSERAANGLAQADHGRALAIALFDAGLRDEALEVLKQSIELEHSPLSTDILRALSFLVEAARKEAELIAAKAAKDAAKEEKAAAAEAAGVTAPDDDAPGDHPRPEPQAGEKKPNAGKGAAAGKGKKRPDGPKAGPGKKAPGKNAPNAGKKPKTQR